jgi:hypothetical protein
MVWRYFYPLRLTQSLHGLLSFLNPETRWTESRIKTGQAPIMMRRKPVASQNENTTGSFSPAVMVSSSYRS